MARRIVRGSSVVVAVALAAGAVSAAAEAVTLQPAHDTSGLVLTVDGRRASVASASGARRRVPLHKGERLSTVAELADGWVVAGVGSEDPAALPDLLVAESGSFGVLRLRLPAPPAGTLRLAPCLLVEQGRLAGLAWLEGADLRSLTVRASAWDGERWAEPVLVSPTGPGSQTGLTCDVLADGGWLLAWARFDGEDDEIVWSLGRGGLFSPPRRVHGANHVPDVTPSLLSSADGALLAWSRFDGAEYRLLGATFRDGSWGSDREISGPGSVYPSLHAFDGDAFLLVRRAWPSGWRVIDFDAQGTPLRRAGIEAEAPDRPLLVRAPGRGIELRFAAGGAARGLEWEPVE